MKLLGLVLLATFAAVSTARADVPELKPVRNAKARVAVTKYTWLTSPNPSVKVDRVCETEFSIPVFDARGMVDGWYYTTASQDCLSEVGGQPAKIALNAAILLTDRNDPIDHSDRKYFNANMSVGRPDGTGGAAPIMGLGSGNGAWSRDINAKTLGLDLEPSQNWICLQRGPVEEVPFPDPKLSPRYQTKSKMKNNDPGSCSPALNEWFSASVEFED